MKLIVGLGNPGAEYTGTRHNVGWEVIALLATRHQIAVTKRGFKSVYGDGQIADERVLLVRPLTFMNNSGEAVGELCRFYKLTPADLIVVLDEVALAPGKIRLRYKGSAGGHNGLASVLSHMGTQDVPRVRIGVGPARSGDLINHVLTRFRREEVAEIEAACQLAADAIEIALRESFELAMTRFNLADRPPKPPRPAQPELAPTDGPDPLLPDKSKNLPDRS